jgi:hypothetical protein
MKPVENTEQITFKPKPKIWNFKDIEGQRFGHLYAVGYLGRTLTGRTIWLVHCDCGTYLRVSIEELRVGAPSNCGCLDDQGLSE